MEYGSTRKIFSVFRLIAHVFCKGRAGARIHRERPSAFRRETLLNIRGIGRNKGECGELVYEIGCTIESVSPESTIVTCLTHVVDKHEVFLIAKKPGELYVASA